MGELKDYLRDLNRDYYEKYIDKIEAVEVAAELLGYKVEYSLVLEEIIMHLGRKYHGDDIICIINANAKDFGITSYPAKRLSLDYYDWDTGLEKVLKIL